MPPAGRKRPSSFGCRMDVLAWLEAINIFQIASVLHHNSYNLKIPHRLDVSLLNTHGTVVISSEAVIQHSRTHSVSFSLGVSTPLQAADGEVIDSTQWSQTPESERRDNPPMFSVYQNPAPWEKKHFSLCVRSKLPLHCIITLKHTSQTQGWWAKSGPKTSFYLHKARHVLLTRTFLRKF